MSPERWYLQLVALFGLDYLQICSILAELDYTPFSGDAAWYREFSRLFLMDPTQPDAFSCVSEFTFIDTSVSSLFSPWLIVAASLVIQALIHYIKPERPVSWKHVCKSALLPIAILIGQVHTAVTLTVINILNVYPYEVFGKRRLRADFSVTTEGGSYDALRVFAGVSLAFVTLGFPLFLVAYLSYRHRTASSASLKKDFLRITSGFRIRNRGYLWPAVQILRRTTLLLFAFLITGSFEQVVVVMVVLLLFLQLGSLMRPYKLASPLNMMELAKSICVTTTAGLGLIRHAVRDDPGEAEAVDYVVVFIQVIMLLTTITGFFIIFSVALKTAFNKAKMLIAARKNRPEQPSETRKKGCCQRRPHAVQADQHQQKRSDNGAEEEVVIKDDSPV